MQNKVVTRQKWIQERDELLIAEKAHTKAREILAARRRALPWVKVEKEYEFESPKGIVPFSDLFANCSQLAIYHLMFGDGWQRPCRGCTAWANALNGTTYQFEAIDAQLIAISRAPFLQIAESQKKNGWSFNWYSSAGSDFNLDYYVSAENGEGGSEATIEGSDQVVEFDRGENHGASIFVMNDAGEIFHTYSVYNRGIEDLNGALGYFDLLPKGRGDK